MDYRNILCDHCSRHKVGTYVEIGVGRGDSLAALLACPQPPAKIVAIDPSTKILRSPVKNRVNVNLLTSDEFFSRNELTKDLQIDMAFIDGMHLFEYALKDFINCEKYSTKDTVIFFHDVLPRSARTVSRNLADVPYQRLYSPWNGDIWKIVPILKEFRPELSLKLHSVRDGLLEVSGIDPASKVLEKEYDNIVAKYKDMPFEPYAKEQGFRPAPLTLGDILGIVVNLFQRH